MGSKCDWETMRHAAETLDELGVPHEVRVVSAHRTPDLLFEYAGTARERGLEVIIAGAGGAAHLPGMAAAKTRLPVLGVPVRVKALRGIDSLLSIVQMPAGVPVGNAGDRPRRGDQRGAARGGDRRPQSAASVAAALETYRGSADAGRARRARTDGVARCGSACSAAASSAACWPGGRSLGLAFRVLDPAADAGAGAWAS